MDCHKVNYNWLAHNILGVKSKNRYKGDAYWYRDNVIFCHEKPMGRLERDVLNGWLVLRLSYSPVTVYMPTPIKHQTGEVLPWLSTPVLGVYSDMPGHMIPSGNKLHEFMLDYYQRASYDMVDRIAGLTTSAVSTEHRWAVTWLRNEASYMTDYYKVYSDHFRLAWPRLPDFHKMLLRRVAELEDIYNDPKSVARRERARARRVALKVLGDKAA